MTRKEKEFVIACRLLHFEPECDCSDISDSDYLKCMNFNNNELGITICPDKEDLNGVILAIYEAGKQKGRIERTEEIHKVAERFRELTGCIPQY